MLVGFAGTYVVLFLLEPVEGALGTISTVTWRRVRNAVGRIGTASTRGLWLGQGNGRGRPSDVALESGHIVYNQPMSDAGSLKSLEKNILCSLPLSGAWIQNQAQWHPPGGHGGMLAGTWKSVNLVHTHVWFTLKTVKSSGWIVVTSDL